MFKYITSYAQNYGRLTLVIILLSFLLILLFYTKLETAFYIPIIEEVLEEEYLAVDTIQAGNQDVYTTIIGKVENKNQITVISFSNGVINKIKIHEGEDVSEGEKLFEITETYEGNEIYDKKLDIAKTQKESAEEAYNLLKSIQDDRENIADDQLDDIEKLLAISRKQGDVIASQLQDLQDLIDDMGVLLEDMEDYSDDIDDLDEQILAQTGMSKEALHIQNDSAILQMKQGITESTNALESLKIQKEQLEYETASDTPKLNMAETNNIITKEQIDSEVKQAKIAFDLANLNIELVELEDDMRTVKSPNKGTIEKIYVQESGFIAQGQPLVLINGQEDLKITAKLSADVSNRIDIDERALIFIDGEEFKLEIESMTTIPTHQNFYEAIFDPSNKLKDHLHVGQLINIKLPINTVATDNRNNIFLPIDVVYKTATSEFVLIMEGEIAHERSVKTGVVVGDQIEILEGVEEDDVVIVDRRVIPGQKVRIQGFELDERDMDPVSAPVE